MKRPPVRDIILLFVITRLMLIVVTYFGYILLTAPKYSSTPVNTTLFFTSWQHWDAANYVRIAQYGYQNHYDFAFFPLLPLLIASISHLLGGYLAVGTLISNAALLGALFVIYQLAADALGDAVARRVLLYLCIFPTAFFFFAAYNESLFLLLTTGAFLAIRRQRWWLAGLLGLLASLTRSAGVLLVLPYLYELWVARESIMASRKGVLVSVLPLFLIPLGTFLYCLYCWRVSGDPFVFATVQTHWARHFSWPWDGIWQNLIELFWIQPFGSFYEAHVLLDLIATLGFIALAILGRRMLRTSYTLWIALLLLFICLSPTTGQHDALISNQRFVLEMFPGFLTLAQLGVTHPRLHQALLMIFPSLLVTLSIIFIMNKWMV